MTEMHVSEHPPPPVRACKSPIHWTKWSRKLFIAQHTILINRDSCKLQGASFVMFWHWARPLLGHPGNTLRLVVQGYSVVEHHSIAEILWNCRHTLRLGRAGILGTAGILYG